MRWKPTWLGFTASPPRRCACVQLGTRVRGSRRSCIETPVSETKSSASSRGRTTRRFFCIFRSNFVATAEYSLVLSGEVLSPQSCCYTPRYLRPHRRSSSLPSCSGHSVSKVKPNRRSPGNAWGDSPRKEINMKSSGDLVATGASMTSRLSRHLLKKVLYCFLFSSLALFLRPLTANAQPGTSAPLAQ
jgi:hypothetical protein